MGLQPTAPQQVQQNQLIGGGTYGNQRAGNLVAPGNVNTRNRSSRNGNANSAANNPNATRSVTGAQRRRNGAILAADCLEHVRQGLQQCGNGNEQLVNFDMELMIGTLAAFNDLHPDLQVPNRSAKH